MELELSDVQSQLDDVLRCKSELEDRLLRMSREKADLSTQLDDSEEELQVKNPPIFTTEQYPFNWKTFYLH